MTPSIVTAHVCHQPAVTSRTSTKLGTCVGTVCSADIPLPSWLYELSPQHSTVPSDLSAHAWLPPTSRLGVGSPENIPRSSGISFPEPQHFTFPLESKAQARVPPAAISTTRERPAISAAGVIDEIVLPVPSWPDEFDPQQRTVPQ